MKTMRILFVTDAPSSHSRRWIETFRDHGHEIHVASFRKYLIPNVSFHLLPTFFLGKFGYLINILKLRALVKKINPDIIHAHHITSYGFVAAMAGVKPLVITAWGSDVLIAPKKSFIIRFITSKALAAADAVTIVAEHMSESVHDLGVSSSRIQTIPFGVDVDLFQPRRDPSSIPQKLHIISTRNFAPIYDIPTLVKALGLLKQRNIDFSATLIGDGPLRIDIEKQISSLGLDNTVKTLGHLEHDQLAKALGNAHIFVSSSLSDGNNVSLTEAMACGCFPIASDIPANRQWIQHGKNGFLYPVHNEIDLADCIGRVFRDPRIMFNAFSVNRQIVETKANWNLSVEKMESLYRNLISFRTA
jgi:glycosyltransferase involved in cell wall biosynthesis